MGVAQNGYLQKFDNKIIEAKVKAEKYKEKFSELSARAEKLDFVTMLDLELYFSLEEDLNDLEKQIVFLEGATDELIELNKKLQRKEKIKHNTELLFTSNDTIFISFPCESSLYNLLGMYELESIIDKMHRGNEADIKIVFKEYLPFLRKIVDENIVANINRSAPHENYLKEIKAILTKSTLQPKLTFQEYTDFEKSKDLKSIWELSDFRYNFICFLKEEINKNKKPTSN